MTSSTLKYLTKVYLSLLVIAIVFIVALGFLFNGILAASSARLAGKVERYFPQKVSIGALFYVPPNSIILKDIRLSEPNASVQRTIIRIPTARLSFSWLKLISNRRIYITDMRIESPTMNYEKLRSFVRENFQNIVELIKSFPKQDISFFIRQAALDLPDNTEGPGRIVAYFALRMKKDSLSGSGFWNEYRFPAGLSRGEAGKTNGDALWCHFSGTLKEDGLILENVELLKENFYCKVWGSSQGNTLNLNGSTFINTLHKKPRQDWFSVSPVEQWKFFSLGIPITPKLIALPRANVYILDIDAQVDLQFPQLRISRLNFSLNNNPFSVKANLVFSEPFSFDLASSTTIAPSPGSRIENLKRIDAKLKGTLREGVLKADGELNLNFVKKKKGEPPLERVKVDLKGLVFSFKTPSLAQVNLAMLHTFCKTDVNAYDILLRDVDARVYLQDERFKFLRFQSLFYGGSLKGKAKIDTLKLPPIISLTMRARNVNAHELDGILIHFSKVYGTLSSQMRFSNYPQMYLKGGMAIHNGYLLDFEFFKWLADYFDLPSLRKIDFSRMSSYFAVNASGARLFGMRLDSKNVGLSGYFGLGESDLVAGKFSLVFTRDLLAQSEKFIPLFRLIGRDAPLLRFDFQLSGWLQKMNFQWLQSDFKNRLKEAIPGFVERKIEKDAEEIIRSISAQ